MKRGVPQADKDRIAALHADGVTAREIQAKTGWSIGTVHRVIYAVFPERDRRPARRLNRGSILARAKRHGIGVW